MGVMQNPIIEILISAYYILSPFDIDNGHGLESQMASGSGHKQIYDHICKVEAPHAGNRIWQDDC